MKKSLLNLIVCSIMIFISSCGEDKGTGVVLFTPDDDLKYGKQVVDAIEADPAQYPVLKETDYPEAYGHIRRILSTILESDKIKYRDKFAYNEIKIIHNDEVLNAFATPGGYIYVYTGLIKYLQHEDHLAGVLGHEIAHAERRHSMSQLQKDMGIDLLLEIVLGEKKDGVITQALTSLVGLKFSRSDESEADEYSVKYLNGSDYQCNGAAGFFESIGDNKENGLETFLSTHPDPDNRVSDINEKANELGCFSGEKGDAGTYAAFKNSLP